MSHMKKNISPILVTTIILNNHVVPLAVNAQGLNKTQVEIQNEIEVKDEVQESTDKQTQSEEDFVEISEQLESQEQQQILTPEVESSQQNQNNYDLQQSVEEQIQSEENEQINTRTLVSVDSEQELIDAVKLNDVTINIVSNITLNQPINIIGSNVTILGNNNKITLNQENNSNMFVIKGTDITINELNIDGYTTNGITVYKAKGITTLNDINLVGKVSTNGTTQLSNVGLDVNESTVKVNGITTANHKMSGIRLQNGSNVTIDGVIKHSNEKADLQSIETSMVQNKFVDNTGIYEVKQATIDGDKTITVYAAKVVSTVNNVEEFKEEIQKANNNIILVNNIVLDENLTITGNNINIEGNGFGIQLGNSYNLTIKANNVTVKDVIFEYYNSVALKLYNAKNINLNEVTFNGNSIDLDKDDRSKIGLDIARSEVTLNNTSFLNHYYKAIQVREGSTVNVGANVTHIDDVVDMQTVYKDGQLDIIINDPNDYYINGNEYTDNNGNKTVDYFLKKVVDIYSIDDIVALKPGSIATLKQDIIATQYISPEKNEEYFSYEIPNNVTFNGSGYTIDLNHNVGIVLKGKDIIFENVTVKNSIGHGIHVYNARNALLKNIISKNNARSGVIFNGSQAKIDGLTTIENEFGGINVTRSRTLSSSSHIDSYVEVIGDLNLYESAKDVVITNLQMVDDSYTDNIFVAKAGMFDEYEHPEVKDKGYSETHIDLTLTKTEINVKEQTEFLGDDGLPIHLVGDGKTDETDKIKELIRMAIIYNRALYFPEGTYIISEDINLNEIGLNASSNFSIKGSETGLTVFDATSKQDSMAKISNLDAHSRMSNVEIKNIIFNNMGIEINGVYKENISLTNNVFINGKYTSHLSIDGELEKVTLTPYVTVKSSEYDIENNVFLRGENYPGRGISTYQTTNTTIKNNFFGKIDNLSDAATMLPSNVIDKIKVVKASGLIDGSDQGNFMTAINNEHYDKNMLIQNNYFKLNKTRNVQGDFSEDTLISGINVAEDGQRRDHIIYSKGYDGLNIVGNYFEGMENSVIGGVKIRNGKGAYIGSNNFNDVGLLTYIYNDLNPEELLLHDTVIYNNVFQQTTNFGGEGTGILYYQSFLEDTNLVGNVNKFIIYNNQFVGDDRFYITISQRAKHALKNNEFYASGNTYYDNGQIVNYHQGNASLKEASEQQILDLVYSNFGYNSYKDAKIPMMPIKVDTQYLSSLVNKVELEIYDLINSAMVGDKVGQYSSASIEEIKNLINQIKSAINDGGLTQSEVNQAFTKLETVFNGLTINQSSPTIPDIADSNNNSNNNYADIENMDNGSEKETSENSLDKFQGSKPQTGMTMRLPYMLSGAMITLCGILALRKNTRK
ncbi:right-handed parallel beta-helix repeat-containing protein [Turicibacter sanguinis]|uniref:right-handed parallel beta-helix repeat-containing protein n=1 Tax=Turicibacter sanguinis TaxID=154288 RepID=UPI002E1F5B11